MNHFAKDVRGYRRNEDGTLDIITVTLNSDGHPVDDYGNPLETKGEIAELYGWPDHKCQEYGLGGNILVPIKNKKTDA